MTTKAEREAAYQALVKLGVPIPPEEIDAVLEAAEGARGVPAESENERLRLRVEVLERVLFENVFPDDVRDVADLMIVEEILERRGGPA